MIEIRCPDCECRFVIKKKDYDAAMWIACPACRAMARADDYKEVEE